MGINRKKNEILFCQTKTLLYICTNELLINNKMEITIVKTVVEKVEINVDDLRVVRTTSRDIDSTNILIHYGDFGLGYGHINNRTNWAHITLNEDNQELEDYLVDAIENRTINIY